MTLSDPEMSTTSADGNEEDVTDWNFCLGNCKDGGITQFLEEHECSKFCEMLNA